MRILYVFDSITNIGGGSQLAVLTWLKNLKTLGVKIKLLYAQNNAKIPACLERNELIINQSINLNLLYPDFYLSPFIFYKTIKAINSFKPDIIHCHEPSIISCQMMRSQNFRHYKKIYSFHTDISKSKTTKFPLSLIFNKTKIGNQVVEGFNEFLFKNADYITTPSKYYQRKIEKKAKQPVFYLPCPIADYFYQNKQPSGQRINKLITISRLSGEKKIDQLIEMMQFLKKKFTLTIVGEGIDREFLELKVKKLNLEKVIQFTGWVKNETLPYLLRKHHLFLSMSDFETFGITYLEALACRIPCLIYDYPISREVIPEKTAIFMKNLEAKNWAKELIKIQNNPYIYSQLVNNIDKEYYKIFAYNEIESTKNLLQIYRKIR